MKKMKYSKKILKVIETPIGDYCWDAYGMCGYFDHQRGCSICSLNFYPLERDKKRRVLKPDRCKLLKEVQL